MRGEKQENCISIHQHIDMCSGKNHWIFIEQRGLWRCVCASYGGRWRVGAAFSLWKKQTQNVPRTTEKSLQTANFEGFSALFDGPGAGFEQVKLVVVEESRRQTSKSVFSSISSDTRKKLSFLCGAETIRLIGECASTGHEKFPSLFSSFDFSDIKVLVSGAAMDKFS